MTLSSASSTADVQAAYDDNSGYEISGSLTEARAFVQACTILLRRTAAGWKHGTQELQRNLRLIAEERDRAIRWIQTQNSSTSINRVKSVDFGGLRD